MSNCRKRGREKDRGSWRSCCHVLLFVCGRFHFIYSYSCRYSWSGSNRERRTGERPVERGLHENCLISPGAKMGNSVQATPTHTHTTSTHTTPTGNAHMSPYFVFSYFCLTICHCLSGLTSGRAKPGRARRVNLSRSQNQTLNRNLLWFLCS